MCFPFTLSVLFRWGYTSLRNTVGLFCCAGKEAEPQSEHGRSSEGDLQLFKMWEEPLRSRPSGDTPSLLNEQSSDLYSALTNGMLKLCPPWKYCEKPGVFIQSLKTLETFTHGHGSRHVCAGSSMHICMHMQACTQSHVQYIRLKSQSVVRNAIACIIIIRPSCKYFLGDWV